MRQTLFVDVLLPLHLPGTYTYRLPEDYAGTIMGDISTRRGRVIGTDAGDAGESIIKVRVPYAEVIEYTKDLRQMTRGTGSFTLELDGYEQAPHDVQEKLIAEYKAEKESK